MIFDNGIDLNINSYMGIYEKGVMVILSINYNDEFYEGTYWYNNEIEVLTLNEPLREKFPNIQEDESYEDIMKFLKENSLDYDKAILKLKEIEI